MIAWLLLSCAAPECVRWSRIDGYVECFDRGTVVVCTDAYVCKEAG